MRTLRQALQGDRPCVSVELPFFGDGHDKELFDLAEALAPAVDAIQIADDPLAENIPSPLALAVLLQRRGLDPVPHLTCRDRNRIALHSDLLGLRALGVSSLVLDSGRGEIPPGADARPVFDMSQREFIAAATALNDEDWGESGHEFLVGISDTPRDPASEWSPAPLLELARAGARFLLLHPTEDQHLLGDYVQALVEARVTWHYSLVVTASLEQGLEACQEQVSRALQLPGVSGVNLRASQSAGDVLEVITSIHRDF